jgi:VanZ family protein
MGHAATAGLNRWHVLLGLLIAYGSLYPFDFTLPEAWLPALRQLLADTRLWSSRGDVLGNVLLFLPWGMAASWQPGAPARTRLPVLLTGLALATALQVMQIALPSRDAALSDIVWNAVGLLLGQFALAPWAARMRGRPGSAAGGRALAWGIAGLWLAGETLPFIPSLDLAHIKAGLKAFAAPASPSPAVLLGAFAGVLVLGHLALTQLARRPALIALLATLPVVAAGRILIIHNNPHWLELAAGAAAWLALLLLRTPGRIAAFAFVALLGAVTLAGLEPYTWSSRATAFNWLPFAAYLNGNMLGNLRELLDTVWHAAALLWLAHAMSARLAGVGGFLVVWVLALETIQLWIPGRSADITPVLTTLLVAAAMARLTRQAGPLKVAPPAASPAQVPAVAGDYKAAPATGVRPRAMLGWALAAWLAGSALLAWLIGQPGVPYNLRELFLGDGHPLAVAVFILAVLSLGAGPRLALDLAQAASRPALRLALLLSAGGLLTLLLLTVSVTGESLDDIAGSNNRYWWVTEREVWGAWAAEFFRNYLTPEVVAPVERIVRFLALYLPPAAFLAVALAAIELRLPARRIAAMAAVLFPLLWLCKAVAFDWSSTDNLNELIAPDGRYGLGGGGYLYLLLALGAANVALLVRNSPQRWPALVFTAAAVPLSWWLLKMGLAEEIDKYELVYSGPQFLLGPDRVNLLEESALQGRWAALYLALVATGSAGVALARRLRPAAAG